MLSTEGLMTDTCFRPIATYIILRVSVRPGSSDAAANCDTLVIVINMLRLGIYRFIKQNDWDMHVVLHKTDDDDTDNWWYLSLKLHCTITDRWNDRNFNDKLGQTKVIATRNTKSQRQNRTQKRACVKNPKRKLARRVQKRTCGKKAKNKLVAKSPKKNFWQKV